MTKVTGMITATTLTYTEGIINKGFEYGDLTGWATGGDWDYGNHTGIYVVNDPHPHSGNFCCVFGTNLL
jgi:hypothetical protein